MIYIKPWVYPIGKAKRKYPFPGQPRVDYPPLVTLILLIGADFLIFPDSSGLWVYCPMASQLTLPS